MLKYFKIMILSVCLPALMEADLDAGEEKRESMLSHIVFFKLKEASQEDMGALVESCKEYLSRHRGTVAFYAGIRDRDADRDVNDTGFDVTLHIMFRNKEAHDRYQSHPRHLKFIEKNKKNWDKVRVFDSLVQPVRRRPRRRPDEHERKRIPLPDKASFFSGMIQAEVVGKRRNGVVVVVKKILKTWEHNKAKDPEAMIGKKVLIVPYREKGEHRRSVHRFLRTLKKNEVVSLDVAHKKGEALMLLELTEKQRKRVAPRER